MSEASVSEPAAPEMVLPEGYSVMFGEDGQQYVTVVQDDQTYAFPAEEFHQMQQVSRHLTLHDTKPCDVLYFNKLFIASSEF